MAAVRPWRWNLVSVLIAFVPAAAAADGMYFPRPSATLVDMEAQRMVLWLRQDGTTELHVQSRYAGAADDFAWIVPLPAQPTVEEGSTSFLDELDRVTAPRFFNEDCYVECPGRWGDAGGEATPDGGTPPPDQTVTVWESGQVGMLDYSVLTAASGSDVLDWLTTNDFQVPAGLVPILDDYVARGFFFFAARVQPGADASNGIDPVKFLLSAPHDPLFPMLITSLVPTPTVRVALWVIADQASYAPENYPYRSVETSRMTVDEYNAEVQRLTALDGGSFVAQFARGLRYYDDAPVLCGSPYGCDMTDEMGELFHGSGTAFWAVTRFLGNLPPSRMVADVVCEAAADLSVPDTFIIPCPGGVVYEGCDARAADDAGDDASPEVHAFGGGGACSASGADPASLLPSLFGLLAAGALAALRARRRRPGRP